MDLLELIRCVDGGERGGEGGRREGGKGGGGGRGGGIPSITNDLNDFAILTRCEAAFSRSSKISDTHSFHGTDSEKMKGRKEWRISAYIRENRGGLLEGISDGGEIGCGNDI